MALLTMAAGFGLGAGAHDVAALMTLLALGLIVWSVALVVWTRQKPWLMPQWPLCLPVAICGALGLWG